MRRPKKHTKKQGKKLATQAYVKRTVSRNHETKYVDIANLQDFTMTADGYIWDWSYPSQGLSDLTRNGDKITPVNIEVNCAMYGADTTNVCRLIIYQNKTTGVATGTGSVSAILAASPIGSKLAPYAPYTHDYRGLYKVLYDKTFQVVNGTVGALRHFKFVIPKKKLSPLQFEAGGTNCVKGDLQFLLISDSTLSTHPTISGYIRMRYKDA